MEYFKYNSSFLNTLSFTTSSYADLDNYLNGVVKNYLNHNYSFLDVAPTPEELANLKTDIEASFDLMLGDVKPRYEEVLRLGTVHTFRSKDTTDSVYGDEERTGKYYEPVVSNAQAQVKTNGEVTTWEDDKVTLSREEDRVLSESAIKDFFKEIKEEVELYFIDYVNLFADGESHCEHEFSQEQLEAINSGITKSKVEQIQTNKENIETLASAVIDLGNNKQDKLSDAQLDSVNSGIDSTKVAQIETNTNNIAQLSNPNILINGDFRVNQRGQSVYNNINATNNEYTFDRWIHYLSNDYTMEPKVDGGITVASSSSGRADFAQIVENGYDLYKGKKLTASISVNGIVSSISITVETSTSANTFIDGTDGSVYLECTSSNVLKVWFRVRAGREVSIDWIKLEMGEIATPFKPRPYAEELALCQRYFLRLGSTSDKNIGLGFSNSAGSYIYTQVPTPTTMRSAFTLSITSLSCKFYDGANLITKSLLSLNGSLSEVNENMCRVAFQIDGTVAVSTLWEARLPANNYLSIDCEIY